MVEFNPVLLAECLHKQLQEDAMCFGIVCVELPQTELRGEKYYYYFTNILIIIIILFSWQHMEVWCFVRRLLHSPVTF